MKKQTFAIKGMHCPSCAMLIEGKLEARGVKAVCSFPKQTVEVEFDPEKVSVAEIKKTLADSGYETI